MRALSLRIVDFRIKILTRLAFHPKQSFGNFVRLQYGDRTSIKYTIRNVRLEKGNVTTIHQEDMCIADTATLLIFLPRRSCWYLNRPDTDINAF